MASNTKRIVAIDLLRGIAIIGMILCAQIGFSSDLPGWMFHCQTPPPTYAFNPDNPGITWVDLVFPFFLFSMGAAFPLAMRKRLDNGASRWEVSASLFRRWLTLTIFALVLGNGYQTGQSNRPEMFQELYDIVLWIVMFLSLARLGGKPWGRHVNNAGMFLLVVMAFIRTDWFGVPLDRWASNIIIMILANIALFGGLIWMFTKDSIRLRWAILLLIAFVKGLSSYAPEALEWVPQLNGISWFFRWKFLQYLFIAIAGSIVGDMLLAQSKTGETPVCDGKATIAGFIAAAAVILQLWGLYTRHVLADFIISAVLGAVYFVLTFRNRNIMSHICYIGFILMLAGICFDPIDGGITKDHCNLSYLFTTSGMAALTASFLLLLEFKWSVKGRYIAGCGQNPMLAYTVTNFFTSPILTICGITAWLNDISHGSPFWGIIRGLIFTIAMMLVTNFFTSRKLFWRS